MATGSNPVGLTNKPLKPFRFRGLFLYPPIPLYQIRFIRAVRFPSVGIRTIHDIFLTDQNRGFPGFWREFMADVQKHVKRGVDR
ncbi:hypothetical protein CU041_15560 [Thalassospira povalilytica]|uniref:Uncharacterized protein n=1 Tax=Thalassospira povalilytica TaxID=732237 RepID=A0ABX4R559_9PROT|nr:hypothetical protein CU041_15560 [Thalassospira povalilytica]